MDGIAFILDLSIVALIAGVAGLICRSIQLSVVVGYLFAGMIIGPYTPPFQLVQDADRIRMLADLGLVFLIFGIGLTFSVRRMQRLGAPLLLATLLGAMIVLLACRLIASMLGFTDQQGLFIAAILMVSSSAIIAKVLEEAKSNHTRWGQLSLGVTLLEDIVAIVMLTLLSSLVNVGEGGGSSIWQLVSSFSGFVILLSVMALLLIPRLLRWLDNAAGSELRMLVVAGLLLVLAWVAVRLGYSMALAAFILGAIIGSTPQRGEVDRLFEGMRHLFGAVFFVAMGMMFDVSLLKDSWPGLVALTAAAFLLRAPAMSLGLMLAGNDTRESIKAGLTVTPLGEFSFVIAFLGVQSGVMGAGFYPAAVGASLLTCLISPVLIRRAEPLSETLEKGIPGPLKRGLESYREWLERLQALQARSIAWRLIAPRIVQTLVQLLFVGGSIALIAPAYSLLKRWVGADLLFPNGTFVVLLIGTGLMLLAPIVAVWRNIAALSMIVAEATTLSGKNLGPARLLIQRAFASTAIAFAAIWLLVLLPTDVLPLPVLGATLLILLLMTILLWKRLIAWQARIEVRLNEELAVASLDSTDQTRAWGICMLDKGKQWQLKLEEFTLPADSLHAGKPIIDLNLRALHSCSIAGIDRQGYAIANPSRNERVFPGDKLLLLGTPEAIDAASAYLDQRSDKPDWLDQFEALATEAITVPSPSPFSGKALMELNLVTRFAVQIAGIRRDGREIVSPGAAEQLLEGDALLVVGTHESIRDFAQALGRPEVPA